MHAQVVLPGHCLRDLVGLGMMMLSPMLVSLPLKIALFVAADGWFLLTKSLLISYGPAGG